MTEMLGMGLLYVGAVLIVNGIWLAGVGSDRDVALINIFAGIVTFLIPMWWAFGGYFGADGTPFDAASMLLFSFTYLWVAANALRDIEDQRLFGWYCLFVALIAAPTGWRVFDGGDLGLALLWWIWTLLWFVFWVLLGMERSEYQTVIGWYTLITGILTGVAGYFMALGMWPW